MGFFRDEKLAQSAITPGELLEINGGLVQAHSTGGGTVGVPLIALESPHVDNPGTDAIDTDYAGSDTVYMARGQTGEEFYMFLAGSQNVSEGDDLESDGAGALQATTGTTERSFVAQAAEDVDNGSNGSRVRIKARIL
jgi:hypothetical protein